MELSECTKCREHKYASHHILAEYTGPIASEGSLEARVCFLGRNPGTSEVLNRKPFQGRAGNELRPRIAALPLLSKDIYIANTVKCFTPSGTSPSATCCKICVDTWLKPEIEALHKLKIIVTLGSEALHVFEDASVTEIHGTSFPVHLPPDAARKVLLFVMYHPAAMFYNDSLREVFNRDFVSLKNLLREERIVK